MKIISVYQPLWSNGVEGIEEYRHCLENEVARTPKTKVLIIGGDHNAHIGRERACETNGRYGLTTPTTEAGGDLLDWCVAHDRQWINSFSNLRKRGTWFNQSHRRWYELDGFIMRRGERHRHAKRIQITEELTLSDHKPVSLHLKIPKRSRPTRVARKPAINCEKFSTEQTALKF